MESQTINVLIPTYQKCKFPYLIKCVNSILGGIYSNVEITVGVNGDKELLELVKTLPVEVYFCEENLGWIKMMNFLIERSESDFVVYGADDLEFGSDCITNAMEVMKEHFPDGDGLVTLNITNTGKAEERGVLYTYHGIMGKRFIERFPKGSCFCPDYVHGFGDLEIGIFAVRINKEFCCEQAQLFQYLIRKNITSSVDSSQILATKQIVKDTVVWKKRKRLGLLWGETDKLINPNNRP